MARIVHLYSRTTGETSSKIPDEPSALITLVSSGYVGCEDGDD